MTIKSVLVRLRGDDSDLNRALLSSAAASKKLGDNLDDADKKSKGLNNSLDVSNDRTTMLVQSALALGPALVPLGAQAVPIIMGLATQMTFAAGAAGTLGLAFSGIGDSLKAVNEYAIDPSAANFEKMNEEMAKLGPAGRDFVTYLQELRPQLQSLQDIAQEGLLPGAQEGIEELMTLLPQVERIVGNIADTLGAGMAQGGATLAGPEWEAFFSYMENEAQPILSDMMATMGNFVQGFANMIVAFGPMTADFSDSFLDMARDFESWSEGLANSEGFASFAAYIAETGPKVSDALGSLANMLLALVEAAAPVGAVALPIIGGIADALAAILRSPAGPALLAAAAGLSAVSRAIALYNVANGGALTGMLRNMSVDGAKAGASAMLAGNGFYRLSAGMGVLALSATDVDEKVGLSNTAMYALMGTMIAPGWGTAIGAIAGGLLDIKAAADASAEAVDKAYAAIASGTRTMLLDTQASLQATLADPGMFTNVGAVTNALNDVNDALDRSAGPADLMGNAIGKTGDQMAAAAEDAASLSAQLTILEGFFDRRASIRAYEASVDALAAGLREGAKDWRNSTKAGRENLDLLDANATAMLQAADKIKNTKLRKSFLTDAREQLVAFKREFPGAAKAIDRILRELDNKLDGFSKPRKPAKPEVDDRPARNKIDKLGRGLDDLASQRPTPKLDADNKPAREKINSTDRLLGELVAGNYEAKIKGDASQVQGAANEARRILSNIADETVIIRAVRAGGFGPQIESARGNFLPGDVTDHHQPQIARGGVTRIWAEPETKGESYIPHADDARRPRAKSILEQTASMFGGAVVWNADGNFMQAIPRNYRQPVGARSAASSAPSRMSVDLGDLRVVGTLDTPWGPAQVEGIARSAARQEMAADSRFDKAHRRSPRG